MPGRRRVTDCGVESRLCAHTGVLYPGGHLINLGLSQSATVLLEQHSIVKVSEGGGWVTFIWPEVTCSARDDSKQEMRT